MKVLFSRICISTQKIHQLSIHHSVLEIRQILESWRPEWPHLIFDLAHSPIFFNQLSISMNLHQHAKNQAVSSFYSRVTVDLKILHSDWSSFGTYLKNQIFYYMIYFIFKSPLHQLRINKFVKNIFFLSSTTCTST